MNELADKRKGPDSPERLVIFLHGYGADGGDLLGLADPLAEHLPGTAFRAPDAPQKCAGNPFGFQWFPIPWLDGSSEADSQRDFLAAKAILQSYLTRVMAEEGVTPAQTAVIGFSQGTMMALATIPERQEQLAGIVAFSGRLIDEDSPTLAVSRPPVMLIHGDGDEMVPFASMQVAGQALQAAGFEVYGHVMKGTGHGIAPDGLSVALAFLRGQFGIE